MSTTTITMSAGTWYKDGDTVNHSSATWLKSVWDYGKDMSNQGFIGFQALLQFQIPNNLKYKRINRATLRYYTKSVWNGSERATSGYAGLSVRPYNADGQALYNLSGYNVKSYGELGEPIILERYSEWASYQYPCWRSADITSIFESNLHVDGNNDVYFAIQLNAMPGFGADRNYSFESNTYALIGSVASGYAAELIIDYEDVTQLAPSPSYPVGTYINENTDLLFSWAWNSSTQAVQAAVELDYKLASAGSWTTVTLTQTAHSYTLVGGLPQGAYQWKIKGTNDAGETSAFSEVAEFTVIGKPGVPVINTPTNAALTTISWQSSDQNSFDITLKDSDGNELINETVASSTSSYKPNLLLKGTYSVGIRYRNSSGLSSDWAYKVFSITAAGPTKPTMALFGDAENVRIVVSRDANINYAVMRAEDKDRDFKIIGVFSEDTYVDKTAKFNTTYSYKVRAYASAGYTDSDVEHFRFNSDRVAIQTSDADIFLSMSEENFLPYSEDPARAMAVYNCPGRKYAIVEHSESDTCVFSTALFVTEKQKEDLTQVAKEDYIFYRDYSGRAFPVAIQTLNFTRYMSIGYIARIEFIRIAEREVVVNV